MKRVKLKGKVGVPDPDALKMIMGTFKGNTVASLRTSYLEYMIDCWADELYVSAAWEELRRRGVNYTKGGWKNGTAHSTNNGKVRVSLR